ncbi:MAG: M15 family metallopeptidase [Actinomycetota bacterium]|nr:M15 family metallopeptidase [Actinomycetota bacterium]
MLRRPGAVEVALGVAVALAVVIPLASGDGRSAGAGRILPGGLQAPRAEAAVARVDPSAPVAPLEIRRRPDVLITATHPLSPATLRRLRFLVAPSGQLAPLRIGTLRIGRADLPTWGIDPGQFRALAPAGTAEVDAVWRAVTAGEILLTHARAGELRLPLGGQLPAAPAKGGPARLIRLGALVTTRLPGVQALISDATAAAYGFAPASGALLSAGAGDPNALAAAVQRAVGPAATVLRLSSSSYRPMALLRGGPAARVLGSFTYHYFADGSIAPDPAWIRSSIGAATVPILGRVTCNRLMLPQLRGALAEVAARGLAGFLHRGEYGGCYNPRFIDHNPSEPISLHTWGIAIDLDVAGNQRGTAGRMDRRVVAIFKRWGFAWGGDWAYTDPMHFELATLRVPG